MNSQAFYEGYHSAHGTECAAPAEKDRMIAAYLERNKPTIGTLLDMGCLNSSLMTILAQRLRIAKYCGVDVIDAGRVAGMWRGLVYERADIDRDDPFPGMQFDVVIASEIIEHVFAPDRIFSLAKERLTPGGLLLVTTPNLGAWYNRLALLFGFQPCYSEVSVRYNVGKVWTASRENVGGHLRMFTLRALKELAACYGLQAVHCASTREGPGLLGAVTAVLSVFPGMGHNLFCVFARR
jgi:SAM-dependent methyltransferase